MLQSSNKELTKKLELGNKSREELMMVSQAFLAALTVDRMMLEPFSEFDWRKYITQYIVQHQGRKSKAGTLQHTVQVL